MGTGNSRVIDEASIWTCQYCTQPFPTYQGAELHEKHCQAKHKAGLSECHHRQWMPDESEEIKPQKPGFAKKVNFKKVLRKDMLPTGKGVETLGKKKLAWDTNDDLISKSVASKPMPAIASSKKSKTSRATRLMFPKREVSFDASAASELSSTSISEEGNTSRYQSESSLEESEKSLSRHVQRTKVGKESKLVADWLGYQDGKQRLVLDDRRFTNQKALCA